jgi:oligopeptide transport system substrate-binding protein
MLRVTALGLLSLATAVSLSGCGGKRDTAATQGLVVSIGIGEPKSLVPSGANDTNSADVLNALFTKLVDYDAQMRPVELAAESITTVDNKVWIIRLRPGWTFHNGEPVTAESYIDAWNAGAWGPNAHDSNNHFSKIAGYDALNPRDARTAPSAKKLTGLVKGDDLTFEVTLSAPYVNFKSMMGYTAFFPLPKAAFLKVAENQIDPAYQEAPIGQGPFKMKGKWQHDQLVETEVYANYAGTRKPQVAGIAFKIYQTLTTQYQDLLADQLDVVPQIPLENIGSAAADLGTRFKQSPASTIQILAFPTYDQRFAKPEIRRAISMAIDRDEIIHTIFRNSQKSLRAFVGPQMPGYRTDSCGEACVFNPQKARALFNAAGGPAAVNGRIEIAYNVDGGHKPWVDATCNQIRTNLGIECSGNPQPKFSELLAKAKRKETMGVFRFGWVFDYPVIENYLGPLYSTHGSSNYYGYSNADFDRLLAAGDQAATPAQATTLYQQAEDLLVRDMPVIPLRYSQNNFGHSTRVANVSIDLYTRVNLLDLTPAPTR